MSNSDPNTSASVLSQLGLTLLRDDLGPVSAFAKDTVAFRYIPGRGRFPIRPTDYVIWAVFSCFMDPSALLLYLVREGIEDTPQHWYPRGPFIAGWYFPVSKDAGPDSFYTIGGGNFSYIPYPLYEIDEICEEGMVEGRKIWSALRPILLI